MGRHLNVEAGCRVDRSAEGSGPFVDQPQLIGERENVVHPGFLSQCADDRTTMLAADPEQIEELRSDIMCIIGASHGRFT